MSVHHEYNISIHPNKETSEIILQRFDRYIVAHTQSLMNHYPSFAHRAVLDLEIDELIQRIRIKFWLMLEKGRILYPHAYIRHIIHSELIDAWRRQKPVLPLPTDEDEEWHQTIGSENTTDPADEVEQAMEELACLRETIPMVLGLPPRQRLAMICSLRDRVDDLVQLVDAFKAYRTDIETLSWPTEQAEKGRLRASLSVARRRLAQEMKERTESRKSCG